MAGGTVYGKFGNLTQVVSTAAELLADANVSGSGAPAHTPQRATQTYTDTATGIKWEWWAGTWTHQ